MGSHTPCVSLNTVSVVLRRPKNIQSAEAKFLVPDWEDIVDYVRVVVPAHQPIGGFIKDEYCFWVQYKSGPGGGPSM